MVSPRNGGSRPRSCRFPTTELRRGLPQTGPLFSGKEPQTPLKWTAKLNRGTSSQQTTSDERGHERRVGRGRSTLSGERVERRLAAILAVEVAGYSRLMGVDEEGTLERLKALRRQLVDPKIKEYRGR